MPVLGALSVTLEVPSLAPGAKFYGDAGLEATNGGPAARFRCSGQATEAIVLVGGSARKRLHHITLRADRLPEIAARVPAAGGTVIAAPAPFAGEGLWVCDPHGMPIHLLDRDASPAVPATAAPFEINSPGRVVRRHRSAMLPRASQGPVKPLRLGHILLFSPDVPRSVAFMVEALGMGLADRAQDVIAFCCARKDSDHHVVAFAKSPGVGFHHVSFEVAGPDEVGRGGRSLAEKTGKGDWGFGRHTIGSNFFHYVQDPWGSWLEYYADMDYIDDYALWTPTNYDMADTLANWGPPVPPDFVHNYELTPGASE
jgi:catechol 2,3-dioxygenase-like lactoylglutathione lyase family enzyme